MSEPATTGQPPGQPRPLVPMIVGAVVSLAAGFLVLQVEQYGVEWLWQDAPAAMSGPLLWAYILLVPAVAGLIVGALRKRYSGHNPLDGFSFAPMPLADFPFALGAILFTLLGGLILGPEIAMITTGVAIGTLLARGHSGKAANQIVAISGIAALLALAVRPALSDSQRLIQGYDFRFSDLFLAAAVALVAALFAAAVRWIALSLQRLRGGDPAIPWQIALAGLVVGALALGYHLATDEPVYLILTSGEGYLHDVTQMTSVGLVLVTVVVKTLGYAISLGSGFRGGPYFPVFFLGTGVGTALALQFGGAPVGVAATAGLIAATTNLAHAGWKVTVIIGLGVGWLVGGLVLLPVSVLAAVIGRLIPHPAAPPAATPAPAADAGSPGDRPAASGG